MLYASRGSYIYLWSWNQSFLLQSPWTNRGKLVAERFLSVYWWTLFIFFCKVGVMLLISHWLALVWCLWPTYANLWPSSQWPYQCLGCSPTDTTTASLPSRAITGDRQPMYYTRDHCFLLSSVSLTVQSITESHPPKFQQFIGRYSFQNKQGCVMSWDFLQLTLMQVLSEHPKVNVSSPSYLSIFLEDCVMSLL